MRKRRVILFDDDGGVLDVLRLFFEARGYEVVAHKRPVPCPLYDDRTNCAGLPPCGDLMITDYQMPGMSGLALLQRQVNMGCTMNVKNKAVISVYLDEPAKTAVETMGCAYIEKPFTFEELKRWVGECEQRMDLTVPLKVNRSEQRQRCSADVALRAPQSSELHAARAINWSDSGLCVVIQRPTEVDQTFEICADLSRLCGLHRVRWTKPLDGESYVVGMLRC